MSRPVRVYQEDWWPFRNLPSALRAFEESTSIKTELVWDKAGVGLIENMFDRMIRSFTEDDPPFDLVCCDEVVLRHFASKGRVLALDDLMARDGITLEDTTAETRRVVTFDGAVSGLPCINVSNLLLYRRDLLDRYSLPVPQSWAEVKSIGLELQAAVRRDNGDDEFYAFASRGASGGGHSVWTMGTMLASFGGHWPTGNQPMAPFGEPYREALSTYVDLLKAVAPPEQGMISFVETTRDFRKGRVGMIVEVGMEYAYMLRDASDLAEKSGVALVPAGPAGRSPNLYTPPWAIPAKSPVRDEAWELAKFLTSSRQLREDGLASGAIETAAMSVLYSPEFDRHFRADLLGAVRASRAIAFEERPFGTLGIDACVAIGDATNAAIVGDLTIDEALSQMHEGIMALGRAD
ncbi:MAG: extracellular solute-binding protein [Hyphomicrobiales bacterium]|nr:extracellular solute-binding protein [Hyphomicrobiales bacterium]